MAYVGEVPAPKFGQYWWAFDPASLTAVSGDCVYADVALNDPLKPGRWRRLNFKYAVIVPP